LPVDLSRLSPDDFKDNELEIPYYLQHFHSLANAVVEKGEHRGYINLPIWRREQDNKPYNARIMENLLSMVYFYCTRRPWNPYYHSPKLRTRIEASLEFWCRIQNTDGRFSEYGPQKWNLAATGFATHFMGEILGLLSNGPNVSIGIFRKALSADRRAIYALLTNKDLYEYGKRFSNQYTNAWPGALLYLDITPDPEIERLFTAVFTESTLDFQSPAGYFYEKDGPDWGYNLGVHKSNLITTWHYLKYKDLSQVVVKKAEKFYNWLVYNAVLEPWKDNSLFFLNKPVETRTSKATVQAQGAFESTVPIAEPVMLARPFLSARESLILQFHQRRKQLEKEWPVVPPLEIGSLSAYIPHKFQHLREDKWYPTATQRKAAIRELPYLKYFSFIHQKMDSRIPAIYTFIKRPTYYVIFNSGKKIQSRQRYGIGLIWLPGAGTILQGQTGTDDAAWGTFAGQLMEAGDVEADFIINNNRITPEVGSRYLMDGALSIQYSISGNGRKMLSFNDKNITVTVDYMGFFREYLPFILRKNDYLDFSDNKILIKRNGYSFMISSSYDVKIEKFQKNLADIEDYQLIVCVLFCENQLKYEFDFPDSIELRGDASSLSQ